MKPEGGATALPDSIERPSPNPEAPKRRGCLGGCLFTVGVLAIGVFAAFYWAMRPGKPYDPSSIILSLTHGFARLQPAPGDQGVLRLANALVAQSQHLDETGALPEDLSAYQTAIEDEEARAYLPDSVYLAFEDHSDHHIFALSWASVDNGLARLILRATRTLLPMVDSEHLSHGGQAIFGEDRFHFSILDASAVVVGSEPGLVFAGIDRMERRIPGEISQRLKPLYDLVSGSEYDAFAVVPRSVLARDLGQPFAGVLAVAVGVDVIDENRTTGRLTVETKAPADANELQAQVSDAFDGLAAQTASDGLVLESKVSAERNLVHVDLELSGVARFLGRRWIIHVAESESAFESDADAP